MMKLRKPLAALLAGAIAATMLPAMPAFAEEPEGVVVNETNFPDPALRNILLNGIDYKDGSTDAHIDYDTDKNGIIDLDEQAAMSSNSNRGLWVYGEQIKNLKGLELFTNIPRISIEGTSVKSIKTENLPDNVLNMIISRNPQLTTLSVTGLRVYLLSVGNNEKLTSATVTGLKPYAANASSVRTAVGFTNNPMLKSLSITDCEGFAGGTVAKCPSLKSVTLKGNNKVGEKLLYQFSVEDNTRADTDYVIEDNVGLHTLTIDSHISSLSFKNCPDITVINLTHNTLGAKDAFFDFSDLITDSVSIYNITFKTWVGSVSSFDLRTIEGLDLTKASGRIKDGVLTPQQPNVTETVNYKFNDDITVKWLFPFDAGSYFRLPGPPETSDPVVWINGKDIKDNKNTPEDETKLVKTYQYQQEGMFSGGKWNVAVTTSKISSIDDFVKLFKDGKPNDDGKKEFADAKTYAGAKIKDGMVTVTAAKKAGTVNVWVYEVKAKNVVNNESLELQPMMTPVEVRMASGAPAIDTELNAGVTKKGISKIEIAPRTVKKLKLGDKKAAFDMSTEFDVQTSNNEVAVADIYTENGFEKLLEITTYQPGTANITVTCVQSGKAAKLTVNCKKPK